MSRRGSGEPEQSTVAALFSAVRQALFGSAWDPGARLAWCRSQRRKLGIPGREVVWVDRDAVPWAEWGAGRGYFLLERMGSLAYLRVAEE